MHHLNFLLKSSSDSFATVCPTLFSSEMCSCREELQWDFSFPDRYESKLSCALSWALQITEHLRAKRGAVRPLSLWNTWDFNTHYEHQKPLTLQLPPESRTRASLIGRDDPRNEMSIQSMLFWATPHALVFIATLKCWHTPWSWHPAWSSQCHQRFCAFSYSGTEKQDHAHNNRRFQRAVYRLFPYSFHPHKDKIN